MASNTERQVKDPSHQSINGVSRNQDHNYDAGCCHLNVEAIKSSFDTIAICGLGLRLPGGIRSADDFWDLLVNGRDAQGFICSDRYKFESFNDTLGNKGAIKTQKGYFLDDDLTSLDTLFSGMSKEELEKTDPQQRQLLEVTRECLESTGETNYRGKLVGCYVGTFGED